MELIVNQIEDQAAKNDDGADNAKQFDHRPEVHAIEQAVIPAEIPLDEEGDIHHFKQKQAPQPGGTAPLRFNPGPTGQEDHPHQEKGAIAGIIPLVAASAR